MRQAYLRQGGANPSMLAQMADLEQEARVAGQGYDDVTRGQRSDRGTRSYQSVSLPWSIHILCLMVLSALYTLLLYNQLARYVRMYYMHYTLSQWH